MDGFCLDFDFLKRHEHFGLKFHEVDHGPCPVVRHANVSGSVGINHSPTVFRVETCEHGRTAGPSELVEAKFHLDGHQVFPTLNHASNDLAAFTVPRQQGFGLVKMKTTMEQMLNQNGVLLQSQVIEAFQQKRGVAIGLG